MTVTRGLWVPINTGNVGTTEVEARLADNALFESNNGEDARSGLLNPQTATVVTGSSAMQYWVSPVNPVINRVAAEGVYRFSTTGNTAIATTAAPAANSRIDVIWIKQNDQSKGDANNLAILGVTQGVVAASPVAPAIPAGALELARSTVGPNITGTTSASITQTFRYAALRGTPIRVRNATEQAEITAPRIGQRITRMDLPGSPDLVRNATRWARSGLTLLGSGALGTEPVVAATPSWTNLATVAATSFGGEVVLGLKGQMSNGNSGEHRGAAFRVTCDGNEVDGFSWTIPYVAGVTNPSFPNKDIVHTPAAGAHTWVLQANAGAAGSVIAYEGTLLVTEAP